MSQTTESQSQVQLDRLPRSSIRGDVYRNLNDDCLSVVDRQTDSDTYGEVIAHTDGVIVENASAVTYEGKRQDALESGCKNVHAFFRGDVGRYDPQAVMELGEPHNVSYQMEREGCFITDDGKTLLEADVVEITREHGIFANGLTTK